MFRIKDDAKDNVVELDGDDLEFIGSDQKRQQYSIKKKN